MRQLVFDAMFHLSVTFERKIHIRFKKKPAKLILKGRQSSTCTRPEMNTQSKK